MLDGIRAQIYGYVELRKHGCSFSECATGFGMLWRMRACVELIKEWYADTRYIGLEWKYTKTTIKAVCSLIIDHYCSGEIRELECVGEIADVEQPGLRYFIEVNPSQFGYRVRHCTQCEYWGC